MEVVAEFCFFEPGFWKFFSAVGHIFAAEDAQLEHLFRSQIGFEIRVEIFADGFGQVIGVTALHQVVDNDSFFSHCLSPPSVK